MTADGSAYAGAEIQVRTGPLAHGSSGGSLCEATGYAARYRNDGKWNFEKELKHPGSGVYSSGPGTRAPLFTGKTIPLNRWLGMKFLVYYLDGTKVRLELYIDSTSDVRMAGPATGLLSRPMPAWSSRSGSWVFRHRVEMPWGGPCLSKMLIHRKGEVVAVDADNVGASAGSCVAWLDSA